MEKFPSSNNETIVDEKAQKYREKINQIKEKFTDGCIADFDAENGNFYIGQEAGHRWYGDLSFRPDEFQENREEFGVKERPKEDSLIIVEMIRSACEKQKKIKENPEIMREMPNVAKKNEARI